MGVWYTTDADLDRSGTWDASRPTCHLPSDVMPDVPMGRDPRIITNRLEIVTVRSRANDSIAVFEVW
jgi:hypothetical protein